MSEPRIEWRLEGLPAITSNARLRVRERIRETKRWRRDAAWVTRARSGVLNRGWPAAGARYVLTRHSTREPDPENLAVSFKAIVDGITDALSLPDDSRRYVDRVYRWEKAPPRKGSVTAVITPWTPPPHSTSCQEEPPDAA